MSNKPKKMKMGVGEIILALTLLFGGAYAGSSYQKNKCDEQLQAVLESSSMKLDSVGNELEAANTKLDSASINLKVANNKLDSVGANLSKANTKLDSLKSLPVKVDTLILVNKEILLNTDTIKSELREHAKKVKNDHAALR